MPEEPRPGIVARCLGATERVLVVEVADSCARTSGPPVVESNTDLAVAI